MGWQGANALRQELRAAIEERCPAVRTVVETMTVSVPDSAPPQCDARDADQQGCGQQQRPRCERRGWCDTRARPALAGQIALRQWVIAGRVRANAIDTESSRALRRGGAIAALRNAGVRRRCGRRLCCGRGAGGRRRGGRGRRVGPRVGRCAGRGGGPRHSSAGAVAESRRDFGASWLPSSMREERQTTSHSARTAVMLGRRESNA